VVVVVVVVVVVLSVVVGVVDSVGPVASAVVVDSVGAKVVVVDSVVGSLDETVEVVLASTYNIKSQYVKNKIKDIESTKTLKDLGRY
jgi:hypothetical protein